jgi:uncharacterized protein (TIGR03545 family)
MQNMTNSTVKTPPPEKKKKVKGPIRTEAIVPTLIIFALVFTYFHFFFDGHIRRGIEYVGTQANGAEVNVGGLETSFFGGYIHFFNIQVTDKNKPHRNLIEIGKINFDLLWDALLRAKIVVEDASVINIQALTPRKTPGYVVPPSDPKASVITKLQGQVVDQMKSQFSGNVLGDAAQLLEGTDPKDLLKNIEGELKSSGRIKELEAELKEKEKAWKERIEKLPQSKEIQALVDRAKKIKFGNDPAQIAKSIKEIDSIVKEVDQKVKYVKETGDTLNGDIKTYDKAFRELEDFVKKDIEDLEARAKIPKIDPKDMAMRLFGAKFASQLAEVRKYSAIAKQYMPPKKTKEEKMEDQVIPPPRSSGHTYQFGRPNSYPLFWLKKAELTSEPTDSEYSGRIRGKITDISSDPVHLGRPIVALFQGDFPKMQIMGLDVLLKFDHTTEIAKESLDMKIGSYPIGEYTLSDSKDVRFNIAKAAGDAKVLANLQQDEVSIQIDSNIKSIDYQVEAKSKIVQEILEAVAKDVPLINVNASASGHWDQLKFNIDSNLASAIGNAFKKQIDAKIAEARAKLKEFIDEKIGKEKAKLTEEYDKIRKQVTGELDKKKSEIDNAKKQAQGNSKNKNKGLEDAGKKALDDLKKKFKF